MIKLVEENMNKSYWPWLGKVFLGRTLTAQATKNKIDKLDFITIKNFCASKDTIKNMQRQLLEREEMNSDKSLIFRIYKEHLQLNN